MLFTHHPLALMALDGHIGSTKKEAAARERACFLEGWTHQALMSALEEQEGRYAQIEKLADFNGGATFLTAEAKKLDAELEALQEELPGGALVGQLLSALRRACKEAAEQDENLYFFGDGVEGPA